VIGPVFFVFFGIIALAAAESPVPSVGGGKFPLNPAEIKLIMSAPAILGVFVIAVCWLPAFLRLLAIPTRQAFAGEVVKVLTSEDYHLVSIDNGSSPTAITLGIDYVLYRHIGLGDQVLVTINPRRRTLIDIEVTATASGLRPAGAPEFP
jgi:hypothetical protein